MSIRAEHEVYIVVRNDGEDLDVYRDRDTAKQAASLCEGVVVTEPILAELLDYGAEF